MREANRRIAGLTSGGGLSGKGHPDLSLGSGERVGIDSGRPLGQLLAAPPSAGLESNSYKRRARLRLGKSQGPSLNSHKPRIPVPSPQQVRGACAQCRARGRAEHTSSQSPAAGGRARRAGAEELARGKLGKWCRVLAPPSSRGWGRTVYKCGSRLGRSFSQRVCRQNAGEWRVWLPRARTWSPCSERDGPT